MKGSLKSLLRNSALLVFASLLLIGVSYVFAAPTAAPPGSTIPLPLTRGATAETKSGPLTVQGLLTASGGVTASAGMTVTGGTGLCIGGTAAANCKTTWPTSTVQAASTNVTATSNLNCTTGNTTASITYWYTNGNAYVQGTASYYYCDKPFTITTSAVPGVPVSASTPNILCLYTGSNYSYTYPATGTFPSYSGSSYTYATGVSVSFNTANQVIYTGTCRLVYGGGSYSPAYSVAYAQGTVRYIY